MSAAVESHELTVRFRAEIHRTFKQMLVRGWRETPRCVQALRGVTFSVGRGEAVGIVGGNGAGKSTLLRTLTGIVTPDSGHAVTRGAVVPMIELSTGFESEFTGRENIAFNGALLGRSRRQMQEREETIIEFSGLADQIDAPMRTYSLGMIARLAFSIAVETDAEILMIDEVLAVGDAGFRERAVARIRKLVGDGATLLLVTHELDLLRALCTRAIWLEKGAIVLDGECSEILGHYEAARVRS